MGVDNEKLNKDVKAGFQKLRLGSLGWLYSCFQVQKRNVNKIQ